MEDNSVIQNMSKDMYRFFLIGFFIILFLPLLNIQPWFSPPDWGKTVVFKFVFSILLFLFIWQILSPKNRFNIKFKLNLVSLVLLLLIVLVGILTLSSALSPEPHYSFLASPYRSGGSLNLILYIFFGILLFLTVKKKHWQKLWDFAIIIGCLVALIAVLQYFHLFGKVLISYTGEIPSTIGGPGFLGMYLLLLCLPSLAFALQEKKRIKKIFYYFCFFFLAIGVLISQSQAAFLGLSLALIYFLILSPKKLLLLKIAGFLFLILGIIFVFYFKANPDNPFNKYSIVQNLTSWRVDQSRLSAWKVSLRALGDKPILGYGYENFAIPFDKHYDPLLPGINRQPRGPVTGWWDRAHNFIFEFALTIGIPGLIVYLSIFALIFFQLQKLKKNKEINQAIAAHGLQAGLIGYFAANFFTFDVYSTFIILFFITAFTLYLTWLTKQKEAQEAVIKAPRFLQKISKFRGYIAFFLLIALICFNWINVFKPLRINKELNWAAHYANNKKCQKAIDKIQPLLNTHSIIDNFVRLKYVDIVRECMYQNPNQRADFAKKAVQLLEEAKESRPTYTRTWLFLGTYINIFVENSPDLDSEIKKELLQKADQYIEKAYQISPKHQEIWVTWAKTHLLLEDYETALEKAQACVDMNPGLADCWWAKGLALIYLNQIQEAIECMNMAIEKGYDNVSKSALLQLLKAYIMMEDKNKDEIYYQRLAEIYEMLINKYTPGNFQYHASLAYTYKMLTRYDKAAEEAIIVFTLSPESRISIENFLSELPLERDYYLKILGEYKSLSEQEPEHSKYNLSLALIYKMLGDYENARKQIEIVIERMETPSPALEDFIESLK